MNFFASPAKCRVLIARSGLPYLLILSMRISLFVIITTAVSVNVLLASPAKSQQIEKVQVEIELKGEPLSSALLKIERQTPFTFLYRNEDVAKVKSLYLPHGKLTVSELLQTLLAGTSLVFKQVDNRIVINALPVVPVQLSEIQPVPADTNTFILSGKILEAQSGIPVPNASIVSKLGRTLAAADGSFRVLMVKGSVLRISCVGYEAVELILKRNETVTISLKPSEQAMKEVVVNGLFTRRAESFTGAVASFSGRELKRVGNVNVLQSLAILDPSFRIVDNLQFGSDPNKLPEVIMRGPSSIPNVNLNTTYSNAPNLPLFILDGFETTVQRVYDLNMNMVASITLLKDASAKAIYGSKAGNGVVVITTLRPAAGNLRLSYTGSVDVQAPDLSSYHLTNALQKLQAEVLAGKYTSAYPENQYPLTQQYSANLQQALSGVNTYWLAQPLQNGVGQKHNIYLDGGTEAMRYSAGISYNDITGAMKGSDRNTISGVVNLQYRKNNVSFSNSLSIDANKSKNSPYGDFSNYSKMNPYWKLHDSTGKLIMTYPVGGTQVYNPLFDATLHTKNQEQYTNITENFYGEWIAAENLRLTARVGITAQNSNSDYFLPGTAVEYADIAPTSPDYVNRGQYTITNGKTFTISSDIGASYSFVFGKSQVFTNLFYSIQQGSNSSNGMTAVGFPNDKLDNISFGNQYLAGSKPAASENTSRNLGVTSAINYSYDNRFLADFSLRESGSSQFGAHNRWGSFWSAGLGWNVHNEAFMHNLSFINQFKIRGSTGTSGTQNFDPYQAISSYNYNTSQVYNGDLGLVLLGLANPNLKWQQVQDNNIGIDARLFKIINLRFDYYISDTKDLLGDQTVAPSTGFPSYKENVGETRNQGYQININTRVYANTQKRIYVGVFANAAHNNNKIRKVSNALKSLNDKEDAILNGDNTDVPATSKPVTRFAEGQSLSAIWGVRSKGIDPANGKEIFVGRDGKETYVWNAADQVVIGDGVAKYTGSFGMNMQWKAFTVNFAFSYRLGGQLYNQTLVDKVENADINYNVDERLLEGRWNTPGQHTLFKSITDNTVTKPTSRFVQDNSELIFSSVNIGYDFSKLKFVKAMKMNSMSLTLNTNDIGRLGSVKTERGTTYPFARTISMSLNANF
jgi:TonB-linked SusC/RagA family outer membrane protein